MDKPLDEKALITLKVSVDHLKASVDRIENKLDGLAVESRLAVIEDRMKILYGVVAAIGSGLIGVVVWRLTDGGGIP